MLKSIQLKLSKVTYGGDSIGDDIRIEIGILDKLFRLDKRVKASSIAVIDKEMGVFQTSQHSFNEDIGITIIEKDILFNDSGNVQEKIRIDTTLAKPQRFTYKIQLNENRSILGKAWGKSIATFEVTIEATVTDAVQYIPDDDEGGGWLQVIIEGFKKPESLPAFLKVHVDRKDSKREYFTILEGVYRGKKASVELQKGGISQFISDIKHEPAVHTSYSISKKAFSMNGKTYMTVDYKDAPWKKGFYDIEIPDFPHGRPEAYREAGRPRTWFRIGHSGDRYLHTGMRSLGCVTITETTRWMEIYNALIRARKGDLMSVGILEIID